MTVAPRDAASVILVRRTNAIQSDAPNQVAERPAQDFEILLTQRPKAMKFMGGAYVFPGGSVDATDSSVSADALGNLSSEALLAAVPSADTDELAAGLLVAAVRETFEEIGVLLCRDSSGEWARAPEYLASRDAATDSTVAFVEFCHEQQLKLATDALNYFGRLITPAFSPIRFDARFFVAAMPEGAVLNIDTKEVDDAIWLTPQVALDRAATGEIDLPIPTMAIVQSLNESTTFEEVTKATIQLREVLVSKISPYVTCILAPNPSLMTGPGTNTYVIGDGPCLIVDPAAADSVYIEAVITAALNVGPCEGIVVTHHHPDHTGGAHALAKLLKTKIYAFDPAAIGAGVEKLQDNVECNIGTTSAAVIHTPGHTKDSISLMIHADQCLIAGDTVAGLGTVVISPPDGNLAEYLATLQRLLEKTPATIFPGHGPVIVDGPGKLREYLSHREAREQQILVALQNGGATIREIVAIVYSDVTKELHPVAEHSVLAHLQKLETEGAVASQDGVYKLE